MPSRAVAKRQRVGIVGSHTLAITSAHCTRTCVVRYDIYLTNNDYTAMMAGKVHLES